MNDAPAHPDLLPERRRRFGPLAGFAPAFGWGLVRVVRWRRVLIFGGVACGLALLLGGQVARAHHPARELARVLDRAILTFGLPLVALFLASEGYAMEVHGRTLVYVLARPVRRATFFVVRFLAGWIPAAVVSVAVLLVLWLASGVAPTGTAAWSIPVTAVLASLALGSIYYALGALFKHGLIAGLVYTFVIETLLSSVPGAMQKYSVMFHVRAVHDHLTAGVLPVVHGPQASVELVPIGVTASSPGESVVTLLVIAAVALSLGAWRTARRDFSLKD